MTQTNEAKVVFVHPDDFTLEVLFTREIDARKFLQYIQCKEFKEVRLEHLEGMYGWSKVKLKDLSSNYHA